MKQYVIYEQPKSKIRDQYCMQILEKTENCARKSLNMEVLGISKLQNWLIKDINNQNFEK